MTGLLGHLGRRRGSIPKKTCKGISGISRTFLLWDGLQVYSVANPTQKEILHA